MSTKRPHIEKILKELLRLNLARQDFLGVKELAVQLATRPVNPSSYIFRPYMAGIVTTYARSFGQNNGIGPLPKEFSAFNDKILKDTHDKLLRLRHGAYAHRDISATKSLTFAGPGVSKSYQLQVRVDENGMVELCSNAPELNPENLPNVAKLCELQSQRAHDVVAKLLPLVMQGKTYAPGIYTAGIDLP